MAKLTKIITLALIIIFVVCIFFALKGKDFYSFKIGYKDSGLTEQVYITIDDGTYNITHFARGSDGGVLCNEKIYGIHFYLSKERHLFIPLKVKIYQGGGDGLSLEGMGGVVAAVIRDFQNASVLFVNERGVANLDGRICLLSNLFLGAKVSCSNDFFTKK
ncbi:PsaF/MyfF family fimbrial adhesin regulatory protein [Salmonella sp. NW805]|uniref:PsaF/MyfF family fimbrial adhesin regulatory protein n=1 Tax=unclassified Salmonella TaxID=2614656 RepID=UPI003F41FD6D|nr:hypothetical protein [Salmonella enterica]HBM0507524.1 hypothetical protein [Salmonella enterica]